MKKNNKMNNIPAVHPMNQLVSGGIPNLPDIFMDAFPEKLPSLSFDAGFISRKVHKWKMRDFLEIKRIEAEVARVEADKLSANMAKITEAIMFGPRIMELQNKMKHEQTMRDLHEKRAQAEVAKIQYETAILANEAKLGDLEVRAKEKQYSHILGDKADEETEE